MRFDFNYRAGDLVQCIYDGARIEYLINGEPVHPHAVSIAGQTWWWPLRPAITPPPRGASVKASLLATVSISLTAYCGDPFDRFRAMLDDPSVPGIMLMPEPGRDYLPGEMPPFQRWPEKR